MTTAPSHPGYNRPLPNDCWGNTMRAPVPQLFVIDELTAKVRVSLRRPGHTSPSRTGVQRQARPRQQGLTSLDVTASVFFKGSTPWRNLEANTVSRGGMSYESTRG
jgi:hypothetical protein